MTLERAPIRGKRSQMSTTINQLEYGRLGLREVNGILTILNEHKQPRNDSYFVTLPGERVIYVEVLNFYLSSLSVSTTRGNTVVCDP